MNMETKSNDNSGNLQEPYTLRCVKPLEVFNELYGEDGVDEEYLYVDAGTYWEILGLVSGRYVRLYGMGEMAGWYIDQDADCLNEHFEVVPEGEYDECD